MSRDWKARNKERALQYTRNWKADNRDHVIEYNKKYDAINRETIQKRQTAYHVRRYNTDPNFRIAKRLRSRYVDVLKSNRLDDSSLKLLGCSIDNFKKWLQYRFDDTMSFVNYGEVWEMDHVIPICKFDLQNEFEVRECFHWSNFQPLHPIKNRSKNCRVTIEEIEQHEHCLYEFLNSLSEHDKNQYSMIEIERKKYVSRSNRGATKVSQE